MVTPRRVDPIIKEWATESQRQAIDAVLTHGSLRAASRALGVRLWSIQERIRLAEKKAALHGYSPAHDMTHIVPDGFKVKGVSTYYDKEGKPTGQWVKSSADEERRQQLMQASIEAMKEEIPRAKPIKPPAHANACLLNCYVVTDYHLNALAWGEETGADWDVSIAEDLLQKWMAAAIALSPDAEEGLLIQLGDFGHTDGLVPVTPASGHVLDADTRFQKVVRIAIRLQRMMIDMLLAKHKKVRAIFADDNHAPTFQVYMREWFSVMYENEPRISIDTSPSPYNAYEFGKVSIFAHHGHKRKPTNVTEVFAAQFRELFGRTKYSYAHMGHLHHVDVKENNLMIVEQHRTLSAADAYAARGGWLSGRDAQVITYHREYGEVSRLKISPDMLKG